MGKDNAITQPRRGDTERNTAIVAHTYHSLTYHIIFSTKERLALINAEFESRLHAYMAGIVNKDFGRARTINGA